MKIDLIKGGVSVDDRGSVRFVNDFNFEGVKRFYQVDNHKQGFIRAWHGHKKEGKYVYVVKGSALIGAVKMEVREDLNDMHETLIEPEGEVFKCVLSSQDPKVLWIPPGYANGFMSLTRDTIIQFFSTSTLKESLGDDIRFPYNKWDIWHVEER
ncbi:sugar epimerase [archaeon]|nr:sugar epimerase [archaeon]